MTLAENDAGELRSLPSQDYAVPPGSAANREGGGICGRGLGRAPGVGLPLSDRLRWRVLTPAVAGRRLRQGWERGFLRADISFSADLQLSGSGSQGPGVG